MYHAYLFICLLFKLSNKDTIYVKYDKPINSGIIEFRSIVHFVILHNKPHSCSLVWISVATFGVSESNRRYSLLFWLRMWHRQHDKADMKDLTAIWNLNIEIILKLLDMIMIH